ncbi:VOC family protein [Azospirillum sp.]|uniref:VOC family protein n=1 Tax=Azospirillum sp. TaxID=34012 RepID=UPI002D5156EC|nr:VOC family protein [Azospirillum sp.]HYD66926.1 VOC family protein [Azospirillum sp.]
MPPRSRIDHVTVAAATLDQGVAYAARVLGVAPPAGGAHPRMGTHNHLMTLGDGLFLEVIAVDPQAPAPGRPRWFALDDADLGADLRARGPRLVTWVARTDDIRATAAASPVDLGPAERMSRGELEWLITIPADGGLPDHGAMPTLIQWPEDRPHPASGMRDLGFRLAGLDIAHPEPQRLQAALDAIGLDRSDGLVTVRPGTAAVPVLSARIRTPAGTVVELGPP